MHNDFIAHSTFQRVTSTRSGRWRDFSGTAVKTLRQKRRPVVSRCLCVKTGAAGFYIEGRLSPEAATATPAEPNALCLGFREASAAVHHRTRLQDRQRGVITKRHQNKIETDLLRLLVHTVKLPPDKVL